ncbi:hypothetical protein ACFX2J_031701 [Malus domestica]
MMMTNCLTPPSAPWPHPVLVLLSALQLPKKESSGLMRLTLVMGIMYTITRRLSCLSASCVIKKLHILCQVKRLRYSNT